MHRQKKSTGVGVFVVGHHPRCITTHDTPCRMRQVQALRQTYVEPHPTRKLEWVSFVVLVLKIECISYSSLAISSSLAPSNVVHLIPLRILSCLALLSMMDSLWPPASGGGTDPSRLPPGLELFLDFNPLSRLTVWAMNGPRMGTLTPIMPMNYPIFVSVGQNVEAAYAKSLFALFWRFVTYCLSGRPNGCKVDNVNVA